MSTILNKFDERAKKVNSLVCVGLDAEISKLPEKFKALEFPQFEFNKFIIEETHEFAAAYKPNSAFYEAQGEQGMKELKMTVDHLKENYPDIFTILDAKRADIGNTNKGYVDSIYDWMGFDSVTVNPYLGFEAISPFTDREDKVAIVLCKTSNPGSGEFQNLKVDGKDLWQIVATSANTLLENGKNVMMVTGATYPEEMSAVRKIAPQMTFLVPGVGAQGGKVEDFLSDGLREDKLGLMINSSRGIIFAENPKEEAKKLRDEINKYRS